MVNAPSILSAKIMHKRLRPKVHGFRYRAYYLCFALSQIDRLKNSFLSLEKWNVLSFYNRDHGARDGTSLTIWIRKILAAHNLIEADGEIILLTLPRILGYVFNPVSFWFCLDQHGQIRAMLSEVNNTYNESHCYLSYHDDHRPIAPTDWLKAQKVFYVSPFLDVTGHYMFRFAYMNNQISVQVNHFDDQGLMLGTSIAGNLKTLNSARTLTSFFTSPLVTLKVISLIHWEAVRLILKGIRRRAKPVPPACEVTR